MVRVSTTLDKDRIAQDGAKQHLLCESCETRFQQLELPFDGYWMRSGRLRAGLTRQPQRVEHLPYAEFKLFHLSILWRMGAATIDKFAHFDLGSHTEQLQQMLFNNDPGPAELYPIAATALVDEHHEPVFDMVGAAGVHTVDGLSFANVIFGGCSWAYFLARASDEIPLGVRKALFRSNGVLPLDSALYTKMPSIGPHIRRLIQGNDR